MCNVRSSARYRRQRMETSTAWYAELMEACGAAGVKPEALRAARQLSLQTPAPESTLPWRWLEHAWMELLERQRTSPTSPVTQSLRTPQARSETILHWR